MSTLLDSGYSFTVGYDQGYGWYGRAWRDTGRLGATVERCHACGLPRHQVVGRELFFSSGTGYEQILDNLAAQVRAKKP